MSEVLSVPKETILKAYAKAKTGRKVFLENLYGLKTFQPEVKERIKTFEDVLRENGIKEEVFIKSCQDLTPDEIAFKKVKEIVKAFNEGWTPNWDNSSQYKYYPYFDMRSSASGGFSYYDFGCSITASNVGSRLCYKSSDLAKHAGQLFESIYKDLFTL